MTVASNAMANENLSDDDWYSLSTEQQIELAKAIY